MMDLFEKIKDLGRRDTNEYLERAAGKGKRVIGYFCSYVPEEMIHAAGFVPYRMRAVGSGGTAGGDTYFSAINCSFVRHCFHKALRGDFNFLDGIVFSNGCDHSRRIYDNWRHAGIKPDFRHMFVVPHLANAAAARARFAEEIASFRSALEAHFNVRIADDVLRGSIALYNKKRSLLADLYESRKRDILPIRGSELLNVMLAITMMPVEDAISFLEEIKKKIVGRQASSAGDARIFLAAGCIEEGEHLELIEKSGGAIVADNICYGARHLDLPVDEAADPVEGLAARYLGHVSCPRMMDDFRRRIEYMHRSIKEFSADAIIAEKLKFCDLWGGELYLIRQESRKHGYPLLALERELYVAAEGQLRTRLQAFFEQIINRRDISDEMIRTAGTNYTVKS
jgi:benzoyl-CoA reductase subunit C